MQKRRSFIRAAGALTATGFIGTSSAKERNEDFTKEEYLKRVRSIYREGGTDALEKGFDDINVDTVEKIEPNDVDFLDDEEITPEESFDENESELVVTSSGDLDDEVTVTVNMLLDGYTPTVRNSWWVDDAIIISYIQQDWAPVGVPTVEADDLLNAEFTTEDVKEDAVAGTVEIETYGAIDSPRLVSLVSDFKLRDSGEPSRIWGGYSHNIAPEPTGSIKSISGGGQGISVELSVGAAAHFNPASATDPR